MPADNGFCQRAFINWKPGKPLYSQRVPYCPRRRSIAIWSGFRLFLRGDPLLKRDCDRAQHVAGGRGLASPDLKLSRGLLHEHFNPRNHGDALGARRPQQVRLHRVIHHVEDQPGLYFVVFKRTVPRVPHSYRGGVNDDVEGNLAQVSAFDAVRLPLPRQLLSLGGSAIQYPDFSPTLFEAAHCSPRSAPGTEHQNFRPIDGESLFDRTNNAGDVGIEAIKLAILSADDGIARADFSSVRVGVIEMGQNRLLVGHRYTQAVQRNLAHAVQQILERFGVKRNIDAIHVFPTQRRVHDHGRERMFYGIAGDSINPSSGIDLLDAVDTTKIARTDLAGRGFETSIRIDGAKRERAAGTHAKHAADNALLSHAQTDDRVLVTLRL